MPKVAGTYNAVVKVKRSVGMAKAESKQEAIRIMLLKLGKLEDRTDFTEWVNGGMEIELVIR